jgi:uncharacterized protein (DUF1501 family)
LPEQTVFERYPFTRRRFIQGSALTAGAVAVSPYLSKLQAFAAPPVADNEGILLTIFLSGGNDGLSMVAPVSSSAYAALRPTLKIAGGHSIGSGLALHPSLVRLKARFDAGKVAVVRGVGYEPADLSHFSSADIWMQGWGGSGSPTTGWLGRYLDRLPNTAHESLYGVGLNGGVNSHLDGAVSHASSLPLNIGNAFGIDRSDDSDARMYDALVSMGSGASGLGPLGDLYNETEKEFMELTQRIRPAYGFDDQPTDIEQQLVLAAHLVNANLGIRVIDTGLDGFDTHSDQATWYATLMSRLDAAIEAFFRTLDAKWHPQVTVMTFSEFGRRPEENGDVGTDHGTAAPLLVIGDHVKGGLHGAEPSLTQLDDDGNLVPTTSFRAVYANVLNDWLEVDGKSIVGRAYPDLSLFKSGPAALYTGSEAGFWLAGPAGAVHGRGSAIKFGSLAHVAHPIVAGAATPSHKGLWLTGADGRIYCFGNAVTHGSTVGRHLQHKIVAMAATPSGGGYWLVTAAGGIFCFGNAKSHGSTVARHLQTPIVAMAVTPSGNGYWLATAGGGIFCFGDAKPHGSTAGRRLPSPIVAMAATPSGNGYWLAAAGGGVYSFGDAHFHGDHVKTAAPVVSMARTPSGKGYWLAAKNGTVGSFGDAPVVGGISATTSVIVRC